MKNFAWFVRAAMLSAYECDQSMGTSRGNLIDT